MAAHPAAWIIGVAVAVRIPLLFTSLTYSSDIWRVVAHAALLPRAKGG